MTTTEVSAARTKLFDALQANTGASPWRIHRTAPASITAPTIYIDSVELSQDSIADLGFVGATFPVVIVVDGADHRQVEQLDDLIAYVWDAASKVGEPTGTRPTSLDVGGPSLKAHQMSVDMLITARTLCPSTLATVGD